MMESYANRDAWFLTDGVSDFGEITTTSVVAARVMVDFQKRILSDFQGELTTMTGKIGITTQIAITPLMRVAFGFASGKYTDVYTIRLIRDLGAWNMTDREVFFV